jgi:putative flippase GtrA
MKLPKVAREGAVFLIVGLAATATNYVAAVGAAQVWKLGSIVAAVVGYLASVAISYFGNSWLTFRRPPLHGPQFARFMAISLAGLAVNLGVVFVGTRILNWPFRLAEIPVVILVPAATFVMAKFWAFREPAPQG